MRDDLLHEALARCRDVLETNRNPVVPWDVEHTYQDKFSLAEWSVKSGAAVQLAMLRKMGLTEEKLGVVLGWRDAKKSVVLGFKGTVLCDFDRKEEREIKSADKTEVKNSLFGKTSVQVVHTETRYFWKLKSTWELAVWPGCSLEEKLVLGSGEGTNVMCTLSEEKTISSPINHECDLSLNWLLACVRSSGVGGVDLDFSIDRTNKDCKTPSRNPQVKDAISAFDAAGVFFGDMHSKLIELVFPGTSLFPALKSLKYSSNRSSWLSLCWSSFPEKVLCPVGAMFCFEDEGKGGDDCDAAADAEKKVYLASGDWPLFEQAMLQGFDSHVDTLLQNTRVKIGEVELEAMDLATKEFCEVVAAASYLQVRSIRPTQYVMRVEEMLETQLSQAIGKVLCAQDFHEYMEYHNRRLFKEAYRPTPFCQVIRRPGLSPEGAVSIEFKENGQELYTTTFKSPEAQWPMHFALDSSSKISFLGDRYVHGAILHEFSHSRPMLQLRAKARQFSSFVLMVGSIASKEEFKPSAALIVSNQAELVMMLDVSTVPTAKEFKDAIASLSPEQQRFCNAFRGMQISSSLFAVLVVQIKPQMERVLNLPADSLTKEIALTNSLMDLFIKYQIPADLLSFNGDPTCTMSEKLDFVKKHVAGIQDMIKEAEAQDLKDALKQRVHDDLCQSSSDDEGDAGLSSELFDNQPTTTGLRFKKAKMHSKSRSRGGGGSAYRGAPAMPMPVGAMMNRRAAPRALANSFGMAAPPPPPQSYAALESAHFDMQSHQEQVNDAIPNNNNNNTQTSAGETNSGFTWLQSSSSTAPDYTTLPKLLEQRAERFDQDSQLRPTIIKPGSSWNKSEKKSLLSPLQKHFLNDKDSQNTEKRRAFDLLDALSRSGGLPCDFSELHVICACTHSFDKTLINVVIQDNVNPIEKVQRSSLIMANTLHGLPVPSLVQAEQLATLEQSCPQSLLQDSPQQQQQQQQQDSSS